MKLYKIARKFFVLNIKLGQYELFQKKMQEIGIPFSVYKDIMLGKKYSAEKITALGIETALKLYDSNNIRSILAIVLTRVRWFHMIPFFGKIIFKRFDWFDEEKIKENEKILLSADFEELEKVMNDFFTGLTSSMLSLSDFNG